MAEILFTGPEAPRAIPVRKRPQSRKPGPKAPQKFQFVSQDATGKSTPETRKVIRSHVMRGKNKKRRNGKLSSGVSWINGDSCVSDSGGQLVEQEDIAEQKCPVVVSDQRLIIRSSTSLLPGPLRPPSDLTLFNFAQPLSTSSRYLITRFFTTIKECLYPAELCFEWDQDKVCWFRWLLSDTAYLESVLFMVSGFQDLVDSKAAGANSEGAWNLSYSNRTQYHLRKTLQLLQEKIQENDTQLSDSTLAVVTTLAMMADASGDASACQTHVEGLKKMVKMRGGLRGFESNRQIQIKLCRVDLGWSIKNSIKPEFFEGDICWDSFMDKALLNRLPQTELFSYPELDFFISKWDSRLQNVFLDLRSFSKMADSLITARRKLQPELFQEIMLSSQYRLLFLENSLDDDPVQEAMRLGLLAYESTVFLQAPGLRLESALFAQQLRDAVENFVIVSRETADLKLWLLFVGAILTFDLSDPWLIEAIRDLTFYQGWDAVRGRLKKVMWINAVHDELGKYVFESMQRAQESHRGQVGVNIPFHSKVSIFAS